MDRNRAKKIRGASSAIALQLQHWGTIINSHIMHSPQNKNLLLKCSDKLGFRWESSWNKLVQISLAWHYIKKRTLNKEFQTVYIFKPKILTWMGSPCSMGYLRVTIILWVMKALRKFIIIILILLSKTFQTYNLIPNRSMRNIEARLKKWTLTVTINFQEIPQT